MTDRIHDGRAPDSPSLRTATTLLWGLVLLALVSVAVQLLDLDALVSEAREVEGSLSEDEARVGVLVGIGVLGAFSVLVRLFFAIMLRSGRGWVRILFTVYAVVVVAMAAIGLTGGGEVLEQGLRVVELALVAAALWFVWRPDARAVAR